MGERRGSTLKKQKLFGESQGNYCGSWHLWPLGVSKQMDRQLSHHPWSKYSLLICFTCVHKAQTVSACCFIFKYEWGTKDLITWRKDMKRNSYEKTGSRRKFRESKQNCKKDLQVLFYEWFLKSLWEYNNL